MMKGRIFRTFLKKWRKLAADVSCPATYDYCQLAMSSCFREQKDEELIPRDVPKGHLVVYVGKDQKRFIVRVAFLAHPLFRALLEQAREEYEFSTPHSKLFIPCDESIFHSILHHINAQREDRKIWICF